MASLQNSIKNISPQDCNNTVTKLFDKVSTSPVNNLDVTSDNLYNLLYFCSKGFEAKEDENYSIPMVWIGVYMAVASFFCILCMVADSLLLCKERYQIPSKYFSLNTTSMMVIAIAMKLTVDLSGSMPGNLDQITKIGSIAFMCTIMAILNPSLASMNNKTLFSNIIGLAIFVSTIAVNLLIQIGTGVIKDEGPKVHVSTDNNGQWKVDEIAYSFDFVYVACVYIGIMLFLLLISISTAIIIPSFKEVLEFKYEVKRRSLNKQHTSIHRVDELTQVVRKYWIMAKTGNPQFVMACNLLSYTSLVLCVTGMGFYIYMLTSLHKENAYDGNFESDYKWSISVILWTQVTGNAIGTIILVSRGFTSMKFKVNDTLRSKHFKIFMVRKEEYWTKRLCEWQGSHSHLGFLSSHSIRCHPIRSRLVIHHTKKVVLSPCILLQLAFVQFNQLMLSPFIFIMRCIIKFEDESGCRLFTTTPKSNDDKKYHDLEKYVLQLEDDDVKPSQTSVVKTISKSMDRLIERSAKKKQNDNLLELLGKYSNGRFKGVEILDDIDPDLPLNSVKLLNSWSVPVITLTCIAIAVPGISDVQVKNLIESIDEALLYAQHVEKSFNSASEYRNISKTAMTLWDDVIRVRKCRWLENPIGEGACGQLPRDILPKSRWLGNPIGEGACGQLPKDILTWFEDKAQPILKEEPASLNNYKLIAARLMHHITGSISSKYQADDEIQTNERFFQLLCSMIADMLVACFSNIPQVIMMKCHANEIEKREASVVAAVKLLGKSTEIIRKLEACTLPDMNPEKRASIHQWLIHLKQLSIP